MENVWCHFKIIGWENWRYRVIVGGPLVWKKGVGFVLGRVNRLIVIKV